MKFIKKNKVVIISVLFLIIMLSAVLIWNSIISKQNEEKNVNSDNFVDVGKVNNISNVEAKLGEDIKITQDYLLNYTSSKASVWYMSKGYVKNIKVSGSDAILTLSEDKDSKVILYGSIDKNKCDVKVGDTINFVGTIDLKTNIIELSKISINDIDYKNVSKISLNDLVTNIEKVKDNYFIVIGFMVTDENKYKLFDSKEAYTEDSSAGNYFLLNWKDEFLYTGNQKVTVKCKIEDTYKLNMCELIQ